MYNVSSTEDTYVAFNILPDGEYYYETATYTKMNGKGKPLLKTKVYAEVVGKGFLYKFWNHKIEFYLFLVKTTQHE